MKPKETKNFKTIPGKIIFLIITNLILFFNNIIQFFKKSIDEKTSQNKRLYRLILMIISIIILFLLKIKHFKIAMINIIFEITFFLILYLLTLPYKNDKLFIYTIKNYIFNILFYFSFFLFIFSSVFILDLITMKYSFYDFNPQIIPFVLKEIIKLSHIFLFILAIIILNLICVFITNRLKNQNKNQNKNQIKNKNKNYNKTKNQLKNQITFLKIFFITIVFIIISIINYSINYQNIANVYVNSINETINLFFREKIQLEENFEIEELSIKNFNYSISPQKKILMFVMEQTSLTDFNRELKNPIFFERTKNISHFYSNYYTQNQDSRLSIWAMMYGLFVPFESYIDNWNEIYGYIMDEKNLIDMFNQNNYKTISAVSTQNSGLILNAFNWSKMITLKDFEEKGNEYICINEFENQKGCEDLSIINEIKSFIKDNNNESYFFLQEMIFGHGENYLIEANTTRTQYYDNYFNEIYEYMLENDLFDENTYIIIVSDHGPKGFEQRQIKDFQLPFYIINKNFEYKENSNLTAHKKLKEIILNEIFNYNLKIDVNELFFIGQSSRNEVGYKRINQDETENQTKEQTKIEIETKNQKTNNDLNEIQDSSLNIILNKNTNQEFIGKLISNNFYLYENINFKTEEIKEKIERLFVLQNSFIDLSTKKLFYCKFCEINNLKFN